ncbi:MAG: hypothetical protein AseanaTS_01030 [Candidatus Pelagadaptatus aseana]|uniref:hypothetical protein n=1 Tax=Candidatus Pelagadaptatus aseana TaxID=3120508 RepID=UPI0039B2141F
MIIRNLIFALCSLISLPSWAETTPPIHVAVVQTEPWGWSDQHGSPQGTIIQNADYLIDHAAPGRSVQFTFASFERVLRMIMAGEADISYNVSDPRLVNGAINVGSLGEFQMEVWRLPQPAEFTERSLHQAPVGIALNVLRQHPTLAQSKLIFLSRPNRLLHMLLAERVEAVVELGSLLGYFAAQAGKSRDDFDILPIESTTAFIWMSKKSPLADSASHWQQTASRIDIPQHFKDVTNKIITQTRDTYYQNNQNNQNPE